MASSKSYLDFILDQLSGLEGVSHRAMMGEYILYCRGRIFGGIYDDRLLVKPTPSALSLMPGAVRGSGFLGNTADRHVGRAAGTGQKENAQVTHGLYGREWGSEKDL